MLQGPVFTATTDCAHLRRFEDHADLPGLKSAEDASGLRHRLLLAFEYAEAEPDPAERERLLTFVIVGGGASGVEIAGDIAELANRTLAQGLYTVPADEVRVMLIEAAPRILPTLPAEISSRSHELLERHGVTLRLGVPVLAVASDHVFAGEERIEARTVVWANASAPPVCSPAAERAETARPRHVRAMLESCGAAMAAALLAVTRQVATWSGLGAAGASRSDTRLSVGAR